MKRTHLISLIYSTIAMLAVVACISNDIPLPRTHANFQQFKVEGRIREASIDSINRTITVYLGESVDIHNVNVEAYSITPGAEVADADFSAPIDLGSPLRVNLRLYQDWQWTISAVQTIERTLRLSGQVGSPFIDAVGHRVFAYVSKTVPITDVLVEEIKLDAEGSTMVPDLSGQRVDFTMPVEVEVTTHGKSVTWTIVVQQTTAAVTTVRVDAWTNVAWIYGQAEVGKNNGIEYRKAGSDDWIRATADQLTVSGGSFCACIPHLEAETDYQARAYSDDDLGAIIDFTTDKAVQVPNSNFDSWWLDGKVWTPCDQNDDQFWDTGNKGATTLGNSNTYPTEDSPSGLGYAACLETKFVGIGVLGKLAAGNIFAGRYVRTDGTNGVLAFGREFTQRPTGLRGKLKYKTAPIDNTSSGFEQLAGQPDTCIVWTALVDCAEPVEIRTNPKNRQLFDSEASYVIAYGDVQFGYDVPDYITFEIRYDYKATNRVPRYILITASASKYGDYFTGGSGAILQLDDFELLYDY